MTTLDAARQERSHRWPWFLPDGRHFLFVSQAPTTIHVGSIDSADRTQVLVSSARAVFADGHLLFVRDGTLLEQPFDARTLKVTGDAVPVADEVWYNAATAGAGLSVSASGVLAYRTGSTREPSQLAWFDRTGKRLGVVGGVADQMNVTLSVDGRKVAVSQLDPIRNARDIAIYDLTRDGLRTRFTFDPADEFSVAWSRDGSRLAFNSARKNGQLDIYEKATTGAGTERLILDDPANNVYPTSWSPDERFLLFYSGNANSPTGNDVFALPMTGEHPVPVPVVQSTFNETNGQFSPDGRWVAFQSSESGRTDIWVVPFAATGPPTAAGAPASVPSGKWQVSTAGGNSPRWRQNGKELFYVFDGRLMAAEVRTEGSAFQVGAVRELFSIRARTANWLGLGIGANYDVSPDGERFLINTVEGEPVPLPITVVVNWVSGLVK